MKKAIIFIGFVMLIMTGFSTSFFKLNDEISSKNPLLTIETPEKISCNESEIFSVDVSISALGDGIYPASSLCIDFNSSCLEFVGIEDGNVLITDTDGAKLPEWSVNTEYSNKTGQINIMYLDISGGKYAFSDKLLSDENNILLKLEFRLRGSAKSGDIYELAISDAVFASSDDEQSLSTVAQTLQTQNGRIIVK